MQRITDIRQAINVTAVASCAIVLSIFLAQAQAQTSQFNINVTNSNLQTAGGAR